MLQDTTFTQKDIDMQQQSSNIVSNNLCKDEQQKYEKIIKDQEKKIERLTRSNEYYRNLEFNKFKNEMCLKDMIKNLEIFMNYIKNQNLNYKIYGNFFERIMSNLSLNETNINIFVNTSQIQNIEGLCDIYFSLNKVVNKDDYNLIKHFVIENGIIIQYYKLELILDYSTVVNLLIHNTKEILNIYSTAENICITENGMYNIYNYGNNNIYSQKTGLDLFMNLFLLKNKKTNLIYDKKNKKLENNESIMNSLSMQLYYENENIQVLNRFSYVIEDCPVCLDTKKCFILDCNHKFCLECLNSHIDNINYENKNCPLCRSEMILK